jgi:hypothetical protein
MAVTWDPVTREDVVRAMEEYDRLGPEGFFSAHGFAPTTTYDLVWDERRYPPKAILGTGHRGPRGAAASSRYPQTMAALSRSHIVRSASDGDPRAPRFYPKVKQ